jgi:hypothetical protein
MERLGMARRSAKGKLASSSPESIIVDFAATTAAPAITFELKANVGSDLLVGQTVPSSAISARGFRLASAGGVLSGKPLLTMTLPPDAIGDRVTTPAGVGWATGSITSKGLIPLVGALGDAQPFTASLNLSQTHQAVVWLTPYKNKQSFISGIITIGDLRGQSRGHSSEESTDGLKWLKMTDGASTSYPGGFGPLDLGAKVSQWEPVASSPSLAQSLGLAFREIQVSYISQPLGSFPTAWSLRDNLSLLPIYPLASLPFSGKASPKLGSFSGLVQQSPAVKAPVNGVFLQDASNGNLIGEGVVKIPVSGTGLPRGSYQTTGIRLKNKQ